MDEDEKWNAIIRSINKAARIPGVDLAEVDMPQYPNWYIARKMHKNLWDLVYSKDTKEVRYDTKTIQ